MRLQYMKSDRRELVLQSVLITRMSRFPSVTAFPLATLYEPCLKTSNALKGKEVYVLIFYRS
eukprot:COSAG06_NODE_5245_length_3613_cov_1.155663_2_plen_62_part_00